MNRIFPISALLALAILTACGGNAAQTPPEPATATATLPQPTATEPPVATESAVPTQEATQISSTEASVSFAGNVMPILESRCIKCHGVESKKEGLSLLNYNDLMAGSFNGQVVIPGDTTNSLMVKLIVEGEMPNRGPKITPEELQVIMDWVNQGALNN
jgi:uncharacterized membrane protein